MRERFDVIVVGGRCAGAPLATLLAGEGLDVGLVERATFPKDTLSTHIFQGPGINFLRQLGVLDKVYETGARPSTWIDGRFEDLRFEIRVPQLPGDEGSSMSVRRFVLDPILLDAAREARVDVMTATNATGLLRQANRVCGVTVTHEGREQELRARLVVGADGRNSTVADLVGARKYNITRSERFGYWGFFANAAIGPDPGVIYHRWEGRFVIATPADAGLYQIVVLPDPSFLPEFRRDREGAFLDHVRACEPAAEVIAGAERVGKLLGIIKYEGFFRESAGPGWALVGDAGHFKDPAPGQGMSDAFRQVQALAPVITRGLRETDDELDAALSSWARRRDQEGAEHYWMGADFGAAGLAPALTVEMLARMKQRDQLAALGDVFQHRTMPSEVFSPARLLAATASRLVRPGVDRREVLREARDLVVTDTRRRWLLNHPEFVASTEHRDAGETEVHEAAAV